MKRWITAALIVGIGLGIRRTSAAPADDDLGQRKAIRGAPVEGVKETDELRALREFDEASFPKPVALGDLLETRGDETTEFPAWVSALKMPDMAIKLDARVLRYLEFYKSDTKGRAIMKGWLARQGRYRAMIERALEDAHLPKALLYVSMIESSYDPQDRSHAGAIGIWQFLPENGRIYGLRIDHYVDERKDAEKSTHAVMRYFADLQSRFGSWAMTLAAFNAGYGAALRSIKKYNTNDYWELCRHENGMPWETTLYVPKLMAVAIVGENRTAFGFDDVPVDPALAWDRVYVDSSMSYAAIANAARVSESQIAMLNPQLRRGRTPPGEGRFEVHVPRGSGATFVANYEKSKEPVRAYTLRFGERLEDVAQQLQTSVKALKTLNGIVDTSEVHPGLVLVVPANKVPTPVSTGETVVVAVPDKDAVVEGKQRIFYRTLPNDSIAEVAKYFSVETADLLRWNHIDADARLASVVLQIWVANDFDASRTALVDAAHVRVVTVGSDEFFDLEEQKRGRVRLSYTVKAGDDLKRIGKKFGLSAADLERINRFGEKHAPLEVGQKLVVYRIMSPSEKAKLETIAPSDPIDTSPPEDEAATIDEKPATETKSDKDEPELPKLPQLPHLPPQ